MDEDFYDFFESFRESCDLIVENSSAKLYGTDPLKVKEGTKYIKLYSNTTAPHNIRDYYFAVVDKQTGNVYLPTGEGGIQGPARGNIYDEDNGLKYITYQGVTLDVQLKRIDKYKKYPENLQYKS